ncbi:MAG TPA: dethiobiotin synthase [Chitinivibrionales bacterium]|nr:dethiobiotin synthase [Chitinivibrionales bacterium]
MEKTARGFFVTGTGTDVGKTFVCRLLARELLKKMPVSYMKPIQTGCTTKKGSLIAPDFEYVKRSGALETGDDNLHVPYRFRPACSPHLAAGIDNEKISLSRVDKCLTKICMLPGMKNGCVLVEGAGGVLVPLGGSMSMIHLIKRLNLPVLLVALPELGTLNHTFLTLCVLHSADVLVAGVVMNNRENRSEDFIYRDNLKTVRKNIGKIPFLEIKYGEKSINKINSFCNELTKKYL